MIKTFLLNISLLFSCFAFAQSGHQSGGTDYSVQGAHAYAQSRHGKDGAVFLDPYFLPFFENIDGLKLLDAGCGAGPWSIVAAQNGAIVYGIDIQENMINLARSAAKDADVEDCINWKVGSVSALPYEENYFDRAISINVGCNLPSAVLTGHFSEMYRVLKPGGRAIITAPASFDVLFSCSDRAMPNIRVHINNEISKLSSCDDQLIRKILNNFDWLLRATFAMRDGKLMLVTDEKMLIEGEAIWRKIPGLAVPNYYHAEKQYIDELLAQGFIIDRIDRPRYSTYAEFLSAKHGLAKEYCFFNAFTIYHISKPD